MYLKSLTLKGFKSFASSTTLDLEPGITCIVGPNGSGKSNVVDALAWVMGEQGAKSLRGGKMEDVIFAGTSGAAGRSPLGRAEVSLTIDNTDGALPIEYAEVTISRTMFRNGGSEYAINGAKARLVDVQDLLSDSGIGREMHVIVGQGRLDSILHATPEERRGFIEEAAGVLKHRKRKEKALRKLDAMEGNLHRLDDLLAEIRRQLKPLSKQAEVARRASVVQADARDARARLAADDLVQARDVLARELADESALQERRTEVEALVTRLRAREGEIEAGLRDGLPVLAQAQETWFALQGLRERMRGVDSLASERLRNAARTVEEPLSTGRDPERLEADAVRARAEEDAALAEVEQRTEALAKAVAERRLAEEAAQLEDRRVGAAVRAVADRREGLARLAGQAAAARGKVDSADAEIGRLELVRTAALERAEAARVEFAAVEADAQGPGEDRDTLDATHRAAVTALTDLDARRADVRTRTTDAQRDHAALSARRDALALGLDRTDGPGAVVAAAAAGTLTGTLGALAQLVTVPDVHRPAVAAVLGESADAIAVADLTAATAALTHLKASDLGRAPLLLAGAPTIAPATAGRTLPAGVVAALDVVGHPEALTGAVTRLLGHVVLVPDLDAARVVVDQHPDLTAVTPAGDVLSAHAVIGGSAARPSTLEVQAAHDETVEAIARVVTLLEHLATETARVQADRAEAVTVVTAAAEALQAHDDRLAAVAADLARLGAREREAHAEADRTAAAIEKARIGAEHARATLVELTERLAHAEAAPVDEVDTTERERLADAARQARQDETDARLALRTAEERARALTGRADALLRQARAERDHRTRAEARRARTRAEARAATAVRHAVSVVLDLLEDSVQTAASERTRIENDRKDAEQDLLAVRSRLREHVRELDDLVNSVHRDELARAQQQMRIEQMEARAIEDLGLAPDVLLAEYGPHVDVPAHDETEPATPYVREEQEKRLRAAERDLVQLGRVNPLALEEFTAMEERHQFLTAQLDDLRRTKVDLLGIVKDVDARVEEVFTQAWHDVREAFDHTFSRLFPGGEGRLLLTDPDDMLTTGVEVEARPPGKKVKRLSLLSGGERSLVAVAFLVALFKARPSPFYILDEVEAALDDTNLGRLLTIYEELRESSQLLVITHQKRTMEVGDALYGVTMRGDGVSTVISQRLT
ncbi:chromosome segregation protein SMC [Nocardioides yefusunii]|uniref:Chromosome partition protein Smc n=1 Tax=Nocardioides yefusunii TaxID=2500546 RepID=A0ABW1QYM9_9ACTN|nr:chromosome segregation protein SMC [Nocardioides yefusunii]